MTERKPFIPWSNPQIILLSPFPHKLINCRSPLNPQGWDSSLCTLLPSGVCARYFQVIEPHQLCSFTFVWVFVLGLAQIHISHFSHLGSASNHYRPLPKELVSNLTSWNCTFFGHTNPFARPDVSQLSLRRCKMPFLTWQDQVQYSVGSISLHSNLFFTWICTLATTLKTDTYAGLFRAVLAPDRDFTQP